VAKVNIKHIVERPDGSVVFQAVLEGQELAFVIETGLEVLIQSGAIPFIGTDRVNLAEISDPPEMEQ
jgi:hypothetical protein